MPEMMSSEAFQPMTFDAIKIGLASPDKIRSWSHGGETKPETIPPDLNVSTLAISAFVDIAMVLEAYCKVETPV